MLGLFFFIITLPSSATEFRLQEIHVTDDPDVSNSLLEFVPSSVSLGEKQLRRRRETSLGDTLKSEVGVTSSGFGPGAGRPIIRGLDGERVRVLQNGLGALDASAQSVDHAVPIDSLNVEKIEILRGPMALLYGTSPLGGVVNVYNQRIHDHFEEGSLAQMESQTETAFGGMANAARLDYGKADWMVHGDGSWRDYGDQRSPKGRVRNSQAEQGTGSLGISRVGEKGFLGISFGNFTSRYGSVAEPSVDILMRQNRWELAGERRFEHRLWQKLRLRSAQTDYRHDEIESGTVGTVFRNSGNETRVELIGKSDEWNHVVGLQTQFHTFSAKGEEAFLPTSQNALVAAFALGERHWGEDKITFSGRIEENQVTVASLDQKRETTGLNTAVGGVHPIGGPFSVMGNLSYTERAPSFQERFAHGAHVATGTFEQGSSELKKEKATGLEGGLRWQSSTFQGHWNIYWQEYQNYIALMPTGAVDGSSGFNIYQYTQASARLRGSEFENRWALTPSDALVVKGDYVRAINRSTGQELPRISPGRVSVGWEKSGNTWSADAEIQHVFAQTKVAARETSTPGYDLVNVGLEKRWGRETQWIVFLRLKNLLNSEARLHTSTVKNISPLPGRNFLAGARLVF